MSKRNEIKSLSSPSLLFSIALECSFETYFGLNLNEEKKIDEGATMELFWNT